MPIKNILNKLKFEEDGDYVEIPEENEIVDKKIMVHIERLSDISDSDRVQKKLRDGDVLLIKTKDLREKDVNELKRVIERIQRTCAAINGDIVGVGDDWLVATPATVKIARQSVAEKQ